MTHIIDRMIAHASAPDVYDAPTPDEMRSVARQWQTMKRALRKLDYWFDADQARLIREALPK